MKKPRPGNIFISIVVAVMLLLGFFVLGGIINQVSRQFQQNDVEVEEPESD